LSTNFWAGAFELGLLEIYVGLEFVINHYLWREFILGFFSKPRVHWSHCETDFWFIYQSITKGSGRSESSQLAFWNPPPNLTYSFDCCREQSTGFILHLGLSHTYTQNSRSRSCILCNVDSRISGVSTSPQVRVSWGETRTSSMSASSNSRNESTLTAPRTSASPTRTYPD
jgi:hypothetical protein